MYLLGTEKGVFATFTGILFKFSETFLYDLATAVILSVQLLKGGETPDATFVGPVEV